MSKANKSNKPAVKASTAPLAVVATPSVTPAQAQAPDPVYNVVGSKRPLSANTKFGKGGNAGTIAALQAAAAKNGGTITASAAKALFSEHGHTGSMFGYAVRNKWLIPAASATQQALAATL